MPSIIPPQAATLGTIEGQSDGIIHVPNIPCFLLSASLDPCGPPWIPRTSNTTSQDPRQYHRPASSSLWDDGDVKGVAKSNTMDVDVPLKELKMMQVPISEHTFCPTPRLYSSQNAIPSTLTINHEDALEIQQPPSSSSVQNSSEPPHSPHPRIDEKQTQPSPSEAMPPPSAPRQFQPLDKTQDGKQSQYVHMSSHFYPLALLNM
ncbi:hypothetical protein BDR03DRAFT_1014603 [Suillus americanus]|nr:hypothetical protein BDR03DRAFT_1014603 [Suillus americanus]